MADNYIVCFIIRIQYAVVFVSCKAGKRHEYVHVLFVLNRHEWIVREVDDNQKELAMIFVH